MEGSPGNPSSDQTKKDRVRKREVEMEWEVFSKSQTIPNRRMCLVFLNCWNFWHCTYPKSSPFFSRDLGIGWKFEYLLQSLTSSKNHLYDLDDDAMLSLGMYISISMVHIQFYDMLYLYFPPRILVEDVLFHHWLLCRSSWAESKSSRLK